MTNGIEKDDIKLLLKGIMSIIEKLDDKHDNKPYNEITIEEDEEIENNDTEKVERVGLMPTSDKHRVKYSQYEKDIYTCVNGDDEMVGQYYSMNPTTAARKIAKNIYRQLGKEIFDFRMYNRMTNKFYSYRAQIIKNERIKYIKDIPIKLKYEIKLVRI